MNRWCLEALVAQDLNYGHIQVARDLNLNILQIWQQQEGHWKLLARQAMRPPQ